MMIKAVPLNLSSLYSPSSSFPRMVRKPTKRIMQNLRSWDPLNSQLPDQEQERVKRTTWTPGEEILFWFGFHFDFDLCLPAKVKKKKKRGPSAERTAAAALIWWQHWQQPSCRQLAGGGKGASAGRSCHGNPGASGSAGTGALVLAKQQHEMRRKLGRQAVALAKAEAVMGGAVWWKELGAITKPRREHVIPPRPESQILPCSNSPTLVSLTHIPSPECTQDSKQNTRSHAESQDHLNWHRIPRAQSENYFKGRSQLRCWDEKQHFTWDRYADIGFYCLTLQ